MSELRADTITHSNGTGPVTLTKQSAAKAWCNLNGTTFGNRAGLNVTSNTDNGTGDYTTTFTNSMNDTNYATVDGSIDSVSSQVRSTELSGTQFTHTTGSYRRYYNLSEGSGNGNFAYDINNVMQAVFGDLA